MCEMKTGGDVLNGLGMFEAGSSKLGIYAGQPSIDQFRSIMSLGMDIYETTPAGNVNISGYMAYIAAWRGINAFQAMGGGDLEWSSLFACMSEAAGKLMAGQPATQAVSNERGELVSEGRPAKKAGGVFSTGQLDYVTGTVFQKDAVKYYDVAKAPSGKTGLVFPYFAEMLDNDADGTFEIFIGLYRNCLSDEIEGLIESVTALRRGFRYLASNRAGKIIQHIYFGIRMAIYTGAKIVLLKDGVNYAGFVLEGTLSILEKNMTRNSLGEEDFKKEISALNSHHASVEKIHEILLAIGRLDGKDEETTVDEIALHPRKLRRMIIERKDKDIEEKRKILDEHIEKLSYRQDYWEINSESLIKFLTAMTQRKNMDDEPLYVHIDTLLNRSSEVIPYIAVFGPQAPSIWYGSQIKAICPIDKPDPNLEKIDNKRAIPHIPYATKGVIAAAQDWSAVYRNKAFKFVPATGKGPVKGFSASKGRTGFIADPNFDNFYTMLRLWVHKEKGDKMDTSSDSKRKRDNAGMDVDGEGRKSQKKPKVFAFL
jgi:hypothetical protein